jgi:hypothetical protein
MIAEIKYKMPREMWLVVKAILAKETKWIV